MNELNPVTTIDAMLVSVFSAYLPGIDHLRVENRVVWDGGIGRMDGFIVKGKLPSGKQWEVPLSIDARYVYENEKGAWLASSEAAREVRKAVQSFKTMIALDGEQSPGHSNHHPSIFGAPRGYGRTGPWYDQVEAHQKAAMKEMSKNLDADRGAGSYFGMTDLQET